MSNLARLLIELGQDTELEREYTDDPRAVMSRYSLAEEEVKAMLDKDVARLKALSGLHTLKSNGSVQSHEP